VPGDRSPQGRIDWTTASVDDAKLTVEIGGDPGAKWSRRLQEIVERLDRGGSGWGEIAVKKKRLHVSSLTEGCESDLRHLVDSAVLQANAEFAADDEDDGDGGDDDRSEPDRDMTDRFRSFSDDAADADADDEGSGDDPAAA
jgi:hypothetical protein